MTTKSDPSTSSLSIKVQDDQLLLTDKSKNIPSLLGLPLVLLPPKLRFIVCSAAVFVFYILYGYLLELLFHTEGIQTHGWFVTFIQFFYYSIFALLQLLISRQSLLTNVPMGTYAIIAVLTVGTMGFSNSSMGYLNYPTQVIFKSCKLIPVMIGSVVILRKTYNFAQVLACVTMCVGLIWFTLADSTVQPNFNMQGVFLVCMSLCCDAIIGNVQEAALRNHHSECGPRLVLYSYGIGFMVIAVILLVTGSFIPGATFVMQHAWDVSPCVLFLSASGFCGVQAVLALVSLHGALVAVTITTARKAVSILLSFLIFSKPFTMQYVWGGGLVVLGIYLNLLAKQQHSLLVSTLNSTYGRVSGALLQHSQRFSEALLSYTLKTGDRQLTRVWSQWRSRCRRCVHAKPPHQFRFDV